MLHLTYNYTIEDQPGSEEQFLTASIAVATDMTSQSGWWWPILTGAWALSSLILLLRVMSDVIGILRLVRQAEKSTLNPGGAVEVRFTADIEGPCMTGWLRPCVLLPLAAVSWPEGTLRATLRHECQHAWQARPPAGHLPAHAVDKLRALVRRLAAAQHCRHADGGGAPHAGYGYPGPARSDGRGAAALERGSLSRQSVIFDASTQR